MTEELQVFQSAHRMKVNAVTRRYEGLKSHKLLVIIRLRYR